MKSVAHLRRLRQLVSTPQDVWLLARMLGWSLVLPMLKRALPLPTLVKLVQSGTQRDQRDPCQEKKLSALSEWVFRSRPRRSRDNCLDRALVTYRYLGRAGATPTIIVGVAKDDTSSRTGVIGHVWVTVDGSPVHDDDERLAGFVTLAIFGANEEVVSQY
jgi:hypothetical protein